MFCWVWLQVDGQLGGSSYLLFFLGTLATSLHLLVSRV